MKVRRNLLIALSLLSLGANAQRIKGSDTVLPVAQQTAERFMNQHPDARVTVTGGGTGVGISALMDNTTDIAMASRPIKFSEKMKIKAAGEEVNEVIVAYDALAVVVHPSNPVKQLTRHVVFIFQYALFEKFVSTGRCFARVNHYFAIVSAYLFPVVYLPPENVFQLLAGQLLYRIGGMHHHGKGIVGYNHFVYFFSGSFYFHLFAELDRAGSHCDMSDWHTYLPVSKRFPYHTTAPTMPRLR